MLMHRKEGVGGFVHKVGNQPMIKIPTKLYNAPATLACHAQYMLQEGPEFALRLPKAYC
jgi:hypothetical protein